MDVGLLPEHRRQRLKCSAKPPEYVDCRGWLADGRRYFPVMNISTDLRLYPQASKDAGNQNNGASNASEANLQLFLDTFVCQSNQQGVQYFFFEYFDEEWKDIEFGGVEGHWGLFYQKCVRRVPSITSIDRFPTVKPSRVSPSPTARLSTWTLLHLVTALTAILLILWFWTSFPVTVEGWFHPFSYTSDLTKLCSSFSVLTAE